MLRMIAISKPVVIATGLTAWMPRLYPCGAGQGELW